jgi:hypothetical protein
VRRATGLEGAWLTNYTPGGVFKGGGGKGGGGKEGGGKGGRGCKGLASDKDFMPGGIPAMARAAAVRALEPRSRVGLTI